MPVGLRVEFSAYLSDPEVVACKHVERAMEHLQRSIAVDGGYRRRWKDAYKKGRYIVRVLEEYICFCMEHGPSRLTPQMNAPIPLSKKVEP